MKRLHRYLLLDLLQNTLLTFAVVMAAFFLIALALLMDASRTQELPFWIVLHYTAYNAVASLYLTIPMTVLTACLFTYGRALAEGEFTAMRVAGIHPYQAVIPALVLGSAATFLLTWLQDEVMPAAKVKARTELVQDLLRNLESVLQRETKITEKGWKAHWKGKGAEEGHIMLYGFELFELDKQGRVRDHTFARVAKPVLNDGEGTLTLELYDLRRSGDRGYSSASNVTIDVPLDALSRDRGFTRRDGYRTYAELFSRARQKAALAEATSDDDERKGFLQDARGSSTNLHFRLAFALSGILFALFGATLGLCHGLGNRIVVFIVGFLIVIGLYYPLEMFGSWLASAGHMPPPFGLAIGNAALLLAGALLFKRIARG